MNEPTTTARRALPRFRPALTEEETKLIRRAARALVLEAELRSRAENATAERYRAIAAGLVLISSGRPLPSPAVLYQLGRTVGGDAIPRRL